MHDDAGSTGEEQWPAGSLSNEASLTRPVRAVGARNAGCDGSCPVKIWDSKIIEAKSH